MRSDAVDKEGLAVAMAFSAVHFGERQQNKRDVARTFLKKHH